jgi:hypothetical protein
VLRIVLPRVSAALAVVYVLSIGDIVDAIGVIYEVIVVVYGDVVVASPVGVVAPATAPRRPHRDTNAERNGHSCDDRSCRGIYNRRIRIDRWTVDHGRVVTGNVNNLRAGLLNDHNSFTFDNFCLYLHLFVRLQIPCAFCLGAHALHRIHYIVLLRKEGVPQVRGPLDVLGQLLDCIRKCRHSLNAGVPPFFLYRLY